MRQRERSYPAMPRKEESNGRKVGRRESASNDETRGIIRILGVCYNFRAFVTRPDDRVSRDVHACHLGGGSACFDDYAIASGEYRWGSTFGRWFFWLVSWRFSRFTITIINSRAGPRISAWMRCFLFLTEMLHSVAFWVQRRIEKIAWIKDRDV